MPHKPTLSDIDAAPETLPAAVEPQPDILLVEMQERFSVVANENFGLRAENYELLTRLQRKEILDSLLVPYANKVYWFLCTYGAGALAVVILDGLHPWGFDLDTGLLQVIVGSTAVSAIGLVGLVVRGLFRPVE